MRTLLRRWFATLLTLLAALALTRLWVKTTYKADLEHCCYNLERLGWALEHYSADHDGERPRDLRELKPGYLKVMPTCPRFGKGNYYFLRSADVYTVVCYGRNHGVPEAHYPRYKTGVGVVVRP